MDEIQRDPFGLDLATLEAVHALASASSRTETCTVTVGFRASVESARADQYDCLTKRAVGRLLAFAPSSGDIKLVSFIRVSDDGHRLTDTEVLLHEDDLVPYESSASQTFMAKTGF